MTRSDALRALLVDVRPADAQEATHVADVLELLDLPGDPFSRDRFDPGHVTASAFVLSPDDDAVLLIHHGKLHRWLQPGGHVEPDDADVVAAARREVAEEVGLVDVELVGGGLFDVDVHVIPPHKGQPAHRHYDVRVLFRARHTAFVVGSDARDARWVPLADVNAVESDASVMRAVGRLRSGGHRV